MWINIWYRPLNIVKIYKLRSPQTVSMYRCSLDCSFSYTFLYPVLSSNLGGKNIEAIVLSSNLGGENIEAIVLSSNLGGKIIEGISVGDIEEYIQELIIGGSMNDYILLLLLLKLLFLLLRSLNEEPDNLDIRMVAVSVRIGNIYHVGAIDLNDLSGRQLQTLYANHPGVGIFHFEYNGIMITGLYRLDMWPRFRGVYDRSFQTLTNDDIYTISFLSPERSRWLYLRPNLRLRTLNPRTGFNFTDIHPTPDNIHYFLIGAPWGIYAWTINNVVL